MHYKLSVSDVIGCTLEVACCPVDKAQWSVRLHSSVGVSFLRVWIFCLQDELLSKSPPVHLKIECFELHRSISNLSYTSSHF